MNKFDILIIGSGPGGYRTAEHAARKGLTVAVFEKDASLLRRFANMLKWPTP